jgi:cellulose synthase/poly-beta-1,6-N-acetylglucosamine synthase-like glycosyltransferase
VVPISLHTEGVDTTHGTAEAAGVEAPPLDLATMRIVALIPAHNEASSIEATIEGMLAQTRRADNTVIVCDNCTDDTFELASKYAGEGITVVRTIDNTHKKSGALNWAWRTFAQDADMVITLDADTVMPENAVGDWAAEFVADPTLGGSSSKFTMRGDEFLVRLQRAEFARWTDTGLRRGWTSVLAGTGCAIRNSCLVTVDALGDREGPWTYESEVEDFELTYRIRELGFHCHISPTVRAYTDAMKDFKSLWAQRMKWQVGTVSDLMHFGYNPLTRIDWLQQAAGLAAAFVRMMWLALTICALVLGTYHFTPIWFAPTLIFILNDTKAALRIPHRDRKDVLLAALLVPQEIFAWMRAGWFLAAWWEVLLGRLTGKKKDRWAMQYQAEDLYTIEPRLAERA